ncbi:MAG: LAGLIDADG family homing endonuclease [Candidatus Heimdallarchaeota archaeon]
MTKAKFLNSKFQGSIMKEMTDEEFLIWLAGFVDGEGSFFITKSSDKRRKTQNFQLYPKIDICNTDWKVLEEIRKRLGIGAIHKKPKKGNRKTQKAFITRNQAEILKLTELLIPYLKVKRKQAELLREFVLLRKQANTTGLGGRRVSYSDRAIHIYKELKALNKRGVEM